MTQSANDGLALGTTLLAIHSFAAFLVFLYCHVNTESQAVFAYFLFFVVDAPTVPLAFEIEGHIGLLSGLTDRWTNLWYDGHQGINLRAFILTALFGGLHWFTIGNLLSYAFRWIHTRFQHRPVSSSSIKGGTMPTRSLVFALSIALANVSAAPTAAGQADDAQALRAHYELQEGKRVYDEFCRFCHGEQGKGKAYNQVSPPPPDLTVSAVQKKSDAELGNIIHDGEPGSPMGAWKWTLSEKDKKNVLLYIRSLAR